MTITPIERLDALNQPTDNNNTEINIPDAVNQPVPPDLVGKRNVHVCWMTPSVIKTRTNNAYQGNHVVTDLTENRQVPNKSQHGYVNTKNIYQEHKCRTQKS